MFGASIYARKFTKEAKTKNTPLDLYIKPHVQKSQSAREQKATAGGGSEKLGLSFLNGQNTDEIEIEQTSVIRYPLTGTGESLSRVVLRCG